MEPIELPPGMRAMLRRIENGETTVADAAALRGLLQVVVNTSEKTATFENAPAAYRAMSYLRAQVARIG